MAVGSRVPVAVPVTLIARFWRRNGRLEDDLEQPQPQRLESCFSDNFGKHIYSTLFICFLFRMKIFILMACQMGVEVFFNFIWSPLQ
ncbi:hypothetical protein Hanom_Chr00s000004g01609441 [Helianthus anomalus]